MSYIKAIKQCKLLSGSIRQLANANQVLKSAEEILSGEVQDPYKSGLVHLFNLQNVLFFFDCPDCFKPISTSRKYTHFVESNRCFKKDYTHYPYLKQEGDIHICTICFFEVRSTVFMAQHLLENHEANELKECGYNSALLMTSYLAAKSNPPTKEELKDRPTWRKDLKLEDPVSERQTLVRDLFSDQKDPCSKLINDYLANHYEPYTFRG